MEEWNIHKLGDICDFQGGSQPPKAQFIPEPKDGYIRLLQIRDFKRDDKAVYIPEAKKNRICKNDDVMIGRYGASVGQILRGKSGAYNVALIKTIPNPDVIDKDFLYLYLQSEGFQKALMSVAERSAQAGFSKADIAPFEIGIPLLEEQKRIVAILDQAFADIELARAKTEQNLLNARELFESYLQQVFSQRGEGWVETTLGHLCEKVEYGTSSKSQPEGSTPVLRMGNIQGGAFNWDKLVYTDNDDDINKLLLNDNDVLFNRTNSPELVGKTAIYRNERPAIFAGYLIRIHRKKDLLDADFLNYYLNSKKARNYGYKVMSHSTNQANINGTKLKEYPINVPELSDQKALAENFRHLENKVKKIESIYEKKLSALDELKKSILQKAFSGELTKTPNADMSKGSTP